MHTTEIEERVRAADGYASLGLFAYARDLLETLPPEACSTPSALTVRLMICAGLRTWNCGMDLCECSAGVRDPCLCEAQGRFLLAYAENLCAAGAVDAARGCVRTMGTVWPEGRDLALSSAALRPIW